MTIDVSKFGKDHWGLMMYVECRCVDHKGALDARNMRVGAEYPTRLNDGSAVGNHDDWDCLEDLEAAGFVENLGTGANPVCRLTDEGMRVAGALRAYRQRGGQCKDFRWHAVCDWRPDVAEVLGAWIADMRPAPSAYCSRIAAAYEAIMQAKAAIEGRRRGMAVYWTACCLSTLRKIQRADGQSESAVRARWMAKEGDLLATYILDLLGERRYGREAVHATRLADSWRPDTDGSFHGDYYDPPFAYEPLAEELRLQTLGRLLECRTTGVVIVPGPSPHIRRGDQTLQDNDPVTATECEVLLGIPEQTTMWFNHEGVVPARAVVDEWLRRRLEAERPVRHAEHLGD